ncbi:MAG: transposase [Okeania sp. SIO2B3]|nr:transposase [Okeania sp. SIO2B3]
MVDRFFPSSKTCSNCGHVQDMPVNLRTYDCPECGLSIDRDLNASINLRDAASSTVNACG